ncbi:MAG: hypothetical protein EZS28_040802, partial [Streblomastix strix]
MFEKAFERPSEVKDDVLWDLLTKMLAFDRKERISAADALNHEFFTGEQATNDVLEEAKNLSIAAQITKNYGDKSITQYDTNPLFIVPEVLISDIFSIDSNADKDQIDSSTSFNQILALDTETGNSQVLEQSIESSISTQTNIKRSGHEIINYRPIVAILKLHRKGNQEQKIQIQKQQEDALLKINDKFKDKEDDEGRNDAISAGVTQELVNIFEKRDLTTISPIYVDAFLNILIPFSLGNRNQVYIKKSPYPGLFRILEHNDIEVVRLSIRSIGSMLICGLIGVQGAEPNLHYESIDSFNGIKKLFSLFKKT